MNMKMSLESSIGFYGLLIVNMIAAYKYGTDPSWVTALIAGIFFGIFARFWHDTNRREYRLEILREAVTMRKREDKWPF